MRRAGALATAFLVGTALPICAMAGDKEAYQHYRKGLELLEAENWNEAIVKLSAAAQERPASGTLRMGMFQEKYFPYYHLGRAHLARGDNAAAIRYFDLEEREGKIQQLNPDLWERLRSERKKAGGAGSLPPPGPLPVPPPGPLPAPTPGPSPSGEQAIEAARQDARRVLEKVRSFEGTHGTALGSSGHQKLTTLDQALVAALETQDAARVVDAQRRAQRGLAELLAGFSDSLLKDQRAFMSQAKERELRDQIARLRYAIQGDDRELMDQLGTDLNNQVAEMRSLIEQAYSAVRTAFARSAAGDPEQAIQTLEEALKAQPDDPALRLILARFCLDSALKGDAKDDARVTRAREQAAQAFRLRPNLSFPERYFSPPFLNLVREVKRSL